MIKFYSISEKESIKKEVLDDKDGAVVSIRDFSLCDTVNHIYGELTFHSRMIIWMAFMML